MATIGSLSVVLSANAGNFNAAMDSAVQKLGGYEKAMQRGAQVAAQFVTPSQQFQKTQKELNDLLAAGAISADVYAKALKKAESALPKSAGKKLGESLANGFKHPIAAIDSLGKAIGGVLQSIPIVGGALAAIPTTGAAFISFLDRATDRMLDVAKTAKGLGVSTESFSGVLAAAGGQSKLDGLSTSIRHFNVLLGEAATGSKAAQDTLRNFGLDWEKLAKVPLAEKFKQTGVELQKLGPLSREFALKELFGKEHKEAAGLLAKGPEGIQQAIDKKRDQGQVFGDADIAPMIVAKKAIKDIGETIDGVGNTIAIKLAPYVATVAKAFQDWINGLGPLPQVFGRVIDWVIDKIATFLDKLEEGFEEVKKTFGDIKGLVDAANNFSVKGAIKGTAKAALSLGASAALAFGAPRLAAQQFMAPNVSAVAGEDAKAKGTLGDKFRNAGKDLKPDLGAPKPDGGLNDELFARQLKVKTGAEDLAESLGKQAAAFGRSATEAKLYELQLQALAAGNSAEVNAALAEAAAAVQQAKAFEEVMTAATTSVSIFAAYDQKMDRLKAAFDQGAISAEQLASGVNKLNDELGKTSENKLQQMFDDAMGPAEKFQAKMADIKRLAEEHRDAMSGEDILKGGMGKIRDAEGMAAFKQFQGLKGQLGNVLPGELTAPKALEKGSAEEFSARTQFERSGLSGNIQEQMKALMEAANMKQDREIELGEQILEALQNQEAIPFKDVTA